MSHVCPRPECDRMIHDDALFACRGDWYALPKIIRDEIWGTFLGGDEAGHLAAMAEAIEWYHANPPQHPRVTRTTGETGDPQ